MPELPDVTVYLRALDARILGATLEEVRIANPFLVRTYDPPLEVATGRRVVELKMIGKRIALGLDGDLWLVLHLMIAGRLHWREAGARIPGRAGLAAFDFTEGTLTLTEAGSKRRASLHLVRARDLASFDRGGLDPLTMTREQFRELLANHRHTLKRFLTNQRILSGIGNAYSDEILHRARLSPVRLTSALDDAECERLFAAIGETLREWIDRLTAEAGEEFPERVTAFRPGMSVHGRFGKPCPVCRAPVQRIRYADNETNYCATCQTEGRVLADRSLSRLLKQDWPRRIEDWEEGAS